jgi:hypothetical protein
MKNTIKTLFMSLGLIPAGISLEGCSKPERTEDNTASSFIISEAQAQTLQKNNTSPALLNKPLKSNSVSTQRVPASTPKTTAKAAVQKSAATSSAVAVKKGVAKVSPKKTATSAKNTADKNSFKVVQSSRVTASAQVGNLFTPSIDAMIPIYGNASQIFYGNLQGYRYGDTYQTLGIGAGFRTQVQNTALIGMYGFYDRQKSSNSQYYDRYNIGFETLHPKFDLRINGYYYPKQDSSTINDLGLGGTPYLVNTNSGSNVAFAHYYSTEQVYSGADVEIGSSLFGVKKLRGYVAYYNYEDTINGGKLRLTYDFSPRIQLLASTQHDDVRGWQTLTGVRYWFGKAPTQTGTTLDRLLEPVVRDMTVAVQEFSSVPVDELQNTKVYFASGDAASATGNGTPSNPMSLEEALHASGEGDIIYLQSGTFVTDKPIHLKKEQTLWGAGDALTYEGYTLIGGTTAPEIQVSNSATETCDSRYCGIYVTESSNYKGFNLSELDTQGARVFEGFLINAESAEGEVNINNVKVHNMSNTGIRVTANTLATLTVEDSHLHNNGYAGFHAKNGDIVIKDTEINNNDVGIYLQDAKSVLIDTTQSHDNTNSQLWIKNGTLNTTPYQINSSSFSGESTFQPIFVAITFAEVNMNQVSITNTQEDEAQDTTLYLDEGAEIIMTNQSNIIGGRIYIADEDLSTGIAGSLIIDTPDTINTDISFVDLGYFNVSYIDGTTPTQFVLNNESQVGNSYHCTIAAGVGSCFQI